MTPALIPLPPGPDYTPDQMLERAHAFRGELARRRTVRDFSSQPVDPRVVEQCLLAAGTAPSGANQQPWRFVVITARALKRRIRAAAEAEEREFYDRRAPQEWQDALAPLGTDAEKPFLEDRAGADRDLRAASIGVRDGRPRQPSYYAPESVGIATGC